ncbi:MAG: mechanosensitive ion channel family protein [Pseudomonadota bacterium]
MQEFFASEFMGVTVQQMVYAFLAILAGFMGRWLSTFVLAYAARLASKTRTSVDDILIAALARPLGWASVLAGIYLALMVLPLPSEPVNVDHFLLSLTKGLSVVLMVWFGMRLTDGVFDRWAEKASTTASKLDDQVIPILRRTLKVFLILLGLAMFLQNMGYSVGSLLAGIGIGGAAIAFASKDTLANLFGAIVIFLDRPFEVGDWVEIGDLEGTVEEVGLRTTRIRTFANSLITMPNANLTTTAINNWSKMQKRRIMLTIGVTYDTPPDKVAQAVQAIRDLIAGYDDFRQDFWMVHFKGFGPSSQDILVYCFTTTTVWTEFMAAQERFLLDISRSLRALGVDFAFPTQTVHVASLPQPQVPTGAGG